MLVEVVADLLGSAEHVEELRELVVLQGASQLRLRKIPFNLYIENININIDKGGACQLGLRKIARNITLHQHEHEHQQSTSTIIEHEHEHQHEHEHEHQHYCLHQHYPVVIQCLLNFYIGSPTKDKYSPRDVCG